MGSEVPVDEEMIAARAREGIGVEALDDLGGGGCRAPGAQNQGETEGGGLDDPVEGAGGRGHGRLLVRTAKENGGRRAAQAGTRAPLSGFKIKKPVASE